MTSSSSCFLNVRKVQNFQFRFLKKKIRIKRTSSFGFWKTFKQLSAFMKELETNWQFRVCLLTWFSNFLEQWLTVKPTSMILFYLWRIRIGSLIFEDSNSTVYIYPTLTFWPQVPKGGNQHIIWIYKEPLVAVS